MSHRTVIVFKDVKVTFIEMVHKRGPLNVCALTQVDVNKGDKIYLIINNHKLFPNRVVLRSEADLIGLETTIEKIKDRWNKVQEFMKEYKDWF